jgi:hypothetical protein
LNIPKIDASVEAIPKAEPSAVTKVQAAPMSLKDFVLNPEPLSPEAQKYLLEYVGETDLIDFKLDFDGSDREWIEITKDIVAFANTHGGYLIFGVVDSTREKKGIELEHAVLLSDPAVLQAKVNRFIAPAITSISCTRSAMGELGPFFVFVHVPPSKNCTHIVVKNGTFQGKTETVTLLRPGEIYVRRVGWKGVVAPPDFEALLERRMEAYKQSLMKNIAQVVEAPTASRVILVPAGDPEADKAVKYRLTSDPSATPLVGVSRTAVPSNDEEELATVVAAFRRDRSNQPSPALLHRLYAHRHDVKVAPEYIPYLVQMCAILEVPCIYWLSQGDPEACQQGLLELLDELEAGRKYNCLCLLALINKTRAKSLIQKLFEGDRHALQKFNGSIHEPGLLFGTQLVDGYRRKKNKLSEDELRKELENLATESALAIADGKFSLPDRWRLREIDAFLCVPRMAGTR